MNQINEKISQELLRLNNELQEYIESDGGDLPTPSEESLLRELSYMPEEQPEEPELIKVDGYDDCFLGVVNRFGSNPIMCYDREKIISNLRDDGMTEEEAEEFFEFNIIGAWVGESTPCFLTKYSPSFLHEYK
jgi:hypothetical protein